MKVLCNGVGTQGPGVTALAIIPACDATDRNDSEMQGDARSYFRPAGVHRRGGASINEHSWTLRHSSPVNIRRALGHP
jgi:hypothetical protein